VEEISSRDPPPRPPTKLTVAQPNGGLVQTTNGVQTQLDVHEGHDVSQRSEQSTRVSINGTAHLQLPKLEDKRTLRSQDGGSRLKSELSIYFQNYDDIINDAPKTPELLSPKSPIYLVDEPLKPPKSAASLTLPHRPELAYIRKTSTSVPTSPSISRHASTHMNGATPIDLPSFSSNYVSAIVDPLPDSFYFKAHRRAERKEKQLRNIEKERAQHEKVQLERLLDGLQGPDWLKVMGVTGVTDGEKKSWEPKRQYFIREVDALVDKFRIWKDEEKRLRLEREEKLAREEDEDDDGEDADGGAEDSESAESDTDAAPPSSDMDAWAARQLQQEARASLIKRPASRAKQKQRGIEPLLPPEPEKPFKSFFDKPHLRAQALGKQRHGRGVLAFGRPVPQMDRRDFELPADLLTEEVVRANARKRRRMRRETKE